MSALGEETAAILPSAHSAAADVVAKDEASAERSLAEARSKANELLAHAESVLAERIAERLAKKIDSLERRGYAANIVLHDGGHRDAAANREPSVTAAGLLLARYAKNHRFVTVDAWG
jgi:hypothetical protein